MFTATVDGFGESEYSDVASKHFTDLRNATKTKGETPTNMLFVLDKYVQIAMQVETKLAGAGQYGWSILLGTNILQKIGYESSNFPALVASLTRETKQAREALLAKRGSITKEMSSGKPRSVIAEDIWKQAQKISLNVGAANYILKEANQEIYTLPNIIQGIKDAPKEVSEAAGAVVKWTTDYTGQVIGKVGAGFMQGLKSAAFNVPWYGWLAVGGAAIGLVAVKTSPAWMPLVKAKLAARGLGDLDEFGFNPYHDGQGKFVRPEQLELRRSRAMDRFGTERPWGSWSDGKGTQEKFLDASGTRGATSVPCGKRARTLHKNIRCGDGAELPYGYAARYSMAKPKKVRKSRAKKALQGYGEFNDSPANEAKLARFIDQHLTNVGPRELLQNAKRLAASDRHILAALHVVKDEASELYKEALKIEHEKPCAKARIGQALKDLNVMIKAVE